MSEEGSPGSQQGAAETACAVSVRFPPWFQKGGFFYGGV